ncbi:MAG TPA: cation:proton antiporter, partial [archaeon]|nr:cation:proton antiporter [archaeon]
MFEILFLAGLIIAIGFASRWIFQKTRIPEVIILMFIGFALGPLGLAVYFGVPGGSMQFFQQAAPIAGAIAIISMVFEAGLRLKVKEFFGKLSMPVLSAFLNMGACIAAVAGALHFIL